MQDSEILNLILETTCDALQRTCDFSPSVARGTVSLALKQQHLTPEHVTVFEMDRLIREALPEMLLLRGIRNPMKVCQDLLENLEPFRRGPSVSEGWV